MFLTGVSKFSRVSIFSDLNNLRDITFSKQFATLLGYTQTELENYFDNKKELKQYETKNYGERFLNDSRPRVYFGVGFAREEIEYKNEYKEVTSINAIFLKSHSMNSYSHILED